MKRILSAALLLLVLAESFLGAGRVVVRAQESDVYKFAYVGPGGNLWLSDTNNVSPEQLTTMGGITEPVFSPDGRYITFIHNYSAQDKPTSEILLYDLAARVIRTLVPGEQVVGTLSTGFYLYNSPAWSPDGKFLYYVSADGRVSGHYAHRLEVSTGAIDDGFHSFFTIELTVAPDGTLIGKDFQNAGDVIGNGFRAFSASGEELYVVLPILPAGLGSPRVSPDGRWFAFFSYGYEYFDRGVLVICELQDCRLPSEPFPLPPSVGSVNLLDSGLSWTPDSQNLVIPDDGVELQIWSRGGELIRTLGEGKFPAVQPQAASSDLLKYSILYVTPENDIAILNPGDDSPQIIAAATENEKFYDPVWAPNGRKILFTSVTTTGDDLTGKLLIHDLVTGENYEMASEQNSDEVFSGPVWAPDSSKILFAGRGDENNLEFQSLYLFDTSSRSAEQIFRDEYTLGGGYLIYIWAPDSNSILYTPPVGPLEVDERSNFRFDSPGIWQYDLTTKQHRQFASGFESKEVEIIEWFPGGQHIGVQAYRPAPEVGWIYYYLVPVKGGEAETILEPTFDLPRLSPSGDEVAYIDYECSTPYDCFNHALAIFNLDTRRQRTLGSLPWITGRPLWSPDGGWLVQPNTLGAQTYKYLYAVDGSSREQLPFTEQTVTWSPDSECLLSGDLFLYCISSAEFIHLAEGSQATWQPIVSEAQDLNPWLDRKRAAIVDLEDVSYEILMGLKSFNVEAFDERQAIALVEELSAQDAISDGQYEAFQRLTYQEETLNSTLDDMALLAGDQADITVDMVGLAWSVMEIVPWSEAGPVGKMLLKVAARILAIFESVSDDPNTNELIQNGADIALEALDRQGSSNLRNVVQEFILGEAIRPGITETYIRVYVLNNQGQINQGVSSVRDPGKAGWDVTGNGEMARLQGEHIANTSANVSQVGHELVLQLRDGLRMNDLFMEIADFATQTAHTPVTFIISSYTRLQQILLNSWQIVIAADAITCVSLVSDGIGERVFQPDQELVACPDLDDISQIPEPIRWIIDKTAFDNYRNTLSTETAFIQTELEGLQAAMETGERADVETAYSGLLEQAETYDSLVGTGTALLLSGSERSPALIQAAGELNAAELELLRSLTIAQAYLESPEVLESEGIEMDGSQAFADLSGTLQDRLASLSEAAEDRPAPALVLADYSEVLQEQGGEASLRLTVENVGSVELSEGALAGFIAGDEIFNRQFSSLGPGESMLFSVAIGQEYLEHNFLHLRFVYAGNEHRTVIPLVVAQPVALEEDEGTALLSNATAQREFNWSGPVLFVLGLGVFLAGFMGLARQRTTARRSTG